MKICSTSLIIREMQIKTTTKYHLTPIRLTFIKKSTNNKYWRRCVEERTFLHCWGECKLVESLWWTVWKFLNKLKIELLCDPSIPLLSIYLLKKKKHNSKRYTHPNVHCSTIHNSQDMEAIQMPINRGMNKEDMISLWNRILLIHWKEWNNVICSNMNGPRESHT